MRTFVPDRVRRQLFESFLKLAFWKLFLVINTFWGIPAFIGNLIWPISGNRATEVVIGLPVIILTSLVLTSIIVLVRKLGSRIS